MDEWTCAVKANEFVLHGDGGSDEVWQQKVLRQQQLRRTETFRRGGFENSLTVSLCTVRGDQNQQTLEMRTVLSLPLNQAFQDQSVIKLLLDSANRVIDKEDAPVPADDEFLSQDEIGNIADPCCSLLVTRLIF